jgi:hypothetical protein
MKIIFQKRFLCSYMRYDNVNTYIACYQYDKYDLFTFMALSKICPFFTLS